MRYLALLVLCVFQFSTFAQEEEEAISLQIVEKLPLAPGCDSTADADETSLCMQTYVMQHIANNFKFPKNARKQGVQAKIFVQFVVERDASVSSVKVLRGASDQYADTREKTRLAAKELDQEAIRVIKSLQFAKPGVQRGKPVRVSYTVPINALLK